MEQSNVKPNIYAIWLFIALSAGVIFFSNMFFFESRTHWDNVRDFMKYKDREHEKELFLNRRIDSMERIIKKMEKKQISCEEANHRLASGQTK